MTDPDIKELRTLIQAMDKRFDAIDRRFDGVDGRLDGIERRLDVHDEQFAAIRHYIEEDKLVQNEILDTVGERTEIIESSLLKQIATSKDHETRITRLEGRAA